MSDPQNYAAKIIADAESLLSKVNGELEEAREFFRSNDINPDKILSACEPLMGAKEKQDLARLIEQDKADIQREVDEATARNNFSKPMPSGGAKRPRNLV
jgi:F0F1-type ATP synthase membrane subunit b/b'